MNFLKGVLFGATPSATELAKISNGQLFLVRPGNIRSSRECIFNEAIATIRRSTVEHHFELVVTRVFDSGDQELVEEDEETDDERSFLISKELEFRLDKAPDGEPNFVWRDLNGDIDEMFEFVYDPDSVDGPVRSAFELCMYRSMYERDNKQSADTLDIADLSEYIWKQPSSTNVALPKRKKVSRGGDAFDIDPNLPTPLSSQQVLVVATAELHRWVPEEFAFTDQGVVQARLLRRTDNAFEFWLTITREDENNPILAHLISDQMNQRLSYKLNTLTWNHQGADGAQRSWLLMFPSRDSFEEIHQTFSRSLWETLHQTPFTKLKPVEQTYVFTSAHDGDYEMGEPEDENEDEDQVMDELQAFDEESDLEDEASPDDPADDENNSRQEFINGSNRNSKLSMGYNGDRMFVRRGNRIGVFKPGDDAGLATFVGALGKIETLKGKEFRPEDFMLHERDSKMVIMNESDHSTLYNMDIEVGKIVEEWKIHDDVQVDHLAPTNKFAPTTGEKTLVGASHNGLFLIDPRLSDTKLVESQFKQYVSKNKFSGVATTAKGQLAVASEKGDIRLFDSIGKNAKTALPPLGDPITGIDTTADGRWIVATTKTYLLLIDTLIGDGKYQGSLGFDRSFPADAKPQPKRLLLSPEHAQTTGPVSFTPARFNAGEGHPEKTIVTSTGQYVIAWNFDKVKKGNLKSYEIKKFTEKVVQDNFVFGNDNQIVVALEHGVHNLPKKYLQHPKHAVIGATAPRKSRSSIVNTPF
ncbi:VID27 cytoplasmic protein-domain-containing protein [Flagelloscypha sp. PMI_526]|nr:VID27 cytoplasmic protein-domain-containing protein [Flagelloscypha sp. PMI_526]